MLRDSPHPDPASPDHVAASQLSCNKSINGCYKTRDTRAGNLRVNQNDIHMTIKCLQDTHEKAKLE